MRWFSKLVSVDTFITVFYVPESLLLNFTLEGLSPNGPCARLVHKFFLPSNREASVLVFITHRIFLYFFPILPACETPAFVPPASAFLFREVGVCRQYSAGINPLGIKLIYSPVFFSELMSLDRYMSL